MGVPACEEGPRKPTRGPNLAQQDPCLLPTPCGTPEPPSTDTTSPHSSWTISEHKNRFSRKTIVTRAPLRHRSSGAGHGFSRCQFRDSPLCPEFPTTWAHFWEALSIIFRETQFSELGPQPTSVSPQRSVLSSWELLGAPRAPWRGPGRISRRSLPGELVTRRPKEQSSEAKFGLSWLLILQLQRQNSRSLVNFPQLYNFFRYFQQLLSLLKKLYRGLF